LLVLIRAGSLSHRERAGVRGSNMNAWIPPHPALSRRGRDVLISLTEYE
jgi:hypothetical protein